MTNEELFNEIMRKLQEHSTLHRQQAEINMTNANVSDDTTKLMLMKHNEMANMTQEMRAMKTDLENNIIEFRKETKETLDEMKKHYKLSDGEAEDLQYLVSNKTRNFLKLIYPTLTYESDPEEYVSQFNYIRRGLWSIIKFEANGNRGGSYKRIESWKFAATCDLIHRLTLRDYNLYREGRPTITRINFSYKFDIEEEKTKLTVLQGKK